MSSLDHGNNKMATGSADRSIKLWDVSKSQADAISTLKTSSSVISCKFLILLSTLLNLLF